MNTTTDDCTCTKCGKGFPLKCTCDDKEERRVRILKRLSGIFNIILPHGEGVKKEVEVI